MLEEKKIRIFLGVVNGGIENFLFHDQKCPEKN
jgi:hypothetical protein